jgi:hypothetical protein
MRYAYYVYYRIEPAKAHLARDRVQALLSRVQAATAVTGRLLCKRNDANLYMEVYDGVEDPHGFETGLAEAVRAERLDELLAAGSVRKLECFQPCA